MARTLSSMRRARSRPASIRIPHLAPYLGGLVLAPLVAAVAFQAPTTRVVLALLALGAALVLAGWPTATERAAMAAADEPRRTRRDWWETAGHGRISRS